MTDKKPKIGKEIVSKLNEGTEEVGKREPGIIVYDIMRGALPGCVIDISLKIDGEISRCSDTFSRLIPPGSNKKYAVVVQVVESMLTNRERVILKENNEPEASTETGAGKKQDSCVICTAEGEVERGLCESCAQDVKMAATYDDTSFVVSAICNLYMKGLKARLGDEKLWKTNIPQTMQLCENHLIEMFADLHEMNRRRNQVPCPSCGQGVDPPVTAEGAGKLISAELKKAIEADAALVKAQKMGSKLKIPCPIEKKEINVANCILCDHYVGEKCLKKSRRR